MALETGTYISDLNASNPAATDVKSQGDDHLRLLKSTIKATFPNISGAVTPTHTELNYVDGVTSAIQTQLDGKATTAQGAKADTAVQTVNSKSGTAITLVKADIGLGSVDNTADADKPISTATQAALDLKADLASPALTGTPTAPTAAVGTATTQIATTAFVAATSFNSALPGQTGNSGKFVTTDGTNAAWAEAVTPAGTQTLTNKTIRLLTEVIATNTAAVASTNYVLTASLTLTLPSSPTAGDWVRVINRSGTTTPSIARNGEKIMGLAEDLTLDDANAKVLLIYANATQGWVIANE